MPVGDFKRNHKDSTSLASETDRLVQPDVLPYGSTSSTNYSGTPLDGAALHRDEGDCMVVILLEHPPSDSQTQ